MNGGKWDFCAKWAAISRSAGSDEVVSKCKTMQIDKFMNEKREERNFIIA